MSTSEIPRYEWAVLSGFGASLLLLLHIKLLPALFAGLLVYSLVRALVQTLRLTQLSKSSSRVLAVTIVAAVVISLITLAGFGLTSFLRGSGETVPALFHRMAQIIEESRDQLPSWLLQYLPADADALRSSLGAWLREHTDIFQVAGAEFGRMFVLTIIGMVVGALLSLERTIPGQSRGPLSLQISQRALRLAIAFRQVVFAQLWISTINTLLTAFYLAVVLPLFGVTVPFVKTLIMITFVAGLLPIVGNLVSNTVIFIVSLSQSLYVAIGSLAYLIVIHKLEYFLNARIVGSYIRARSWEILIAMLVMEAAFGIAGLIAAPIYYAYLKDELLAKDLL
jgi:predicted PurR-regulated permease PerM